MKTVITETFVEENERTLSEYIRKKRDQSLKKILT